MRFVSTPGAGQLSKPVPATSISNGERSKVSNCSYLKVGRGCLKRFHAHCLGQDESQGLRSLIYFVFRALGNYSNTQLQGSLLFSKFEFSIKPDLRGLSFS